MVLAEDFKRSERCTKKITHARMKIPPDFNSRYFFEGVQVEEISLFRLERKFPSSSQIEGRKVNKVRGGEETGREGPEAEQKGREGKKVHYRLRPSSGFRGKRGGGANVILD